MKWQTVSEIQNDRFEIEKCTGDCENGQNFAKIGSVNGMGSDRIGQAYTFEDELPTIGANYYRLKQVDINGAFSYSHTIEINTEKT